MAINDHAHPPTGPTAKDILNLSHGLQQDLAAAQAKLVTIRSWLAAQKLAARVFEHECPHDGYGFQTAGRLAEHLANVHGEGAPHSELGEAEEAFS